MIGRVFGASLPVILALAGVVAALPAEAAPRVSVETVYYDVHGTSAQALVSYMLRHGPGGATGRALGTTSALIRHDGDLVGGDRCRLENYRVELELTIRLPRLAGGQQLSGSTRRQFNAFAEHVRRHENTHKTIYQRYARRIEQQVRALSGTMSCAQLRARMRQVFNQLNDQCDAEHRAFDAKEAVRIRSLPLIVRASQPAPSQPSVSSSRSTQAANAPARRVSGPAIEDLK